jgi:choline dehydrogenase-like flavoprotein
MNHPNILDHTQLTRDQDISCEVCIVGSGAGGAMLAAQLTQKGFDVVMLEAGSNRYAKHFNMNEAEAFNTLYQEGGLRSTDDIGISILQGATLGGSTTINWTTCFRTPERILQIWNDRYGLHELTPEKMDPYFSAVEKRLNINPWPEAAANANNKVIAQGAKALGWEHSVLRRNVKGCVNSGYCGMGNAPNDHPRCIGFRNEALL